MAPNKSSPLAGILITAFFGTVSLILAAITMYQVHSIWVRYHHHAQENKTAEDIKLQNSACEPTTEEWQDTPTPSASLRAADQTYTVPRRVHILPSDDITMTPRRSAFDEARFDLGLGIVSRFSIDSSECGWGDGIDAPTNTPESVTVGSIEEV